MVHNLKGWCDLPHFGFIFKCLVPLCKNHFLNTWHNDKRKDKVDKKCIFYETEPENFSNSKAKYNLLQE